MADRVVLHVGTMKSGTTYLQRSLESGVLEGAGGFYVGGAFGAQTAKYTPSTPPTFLKCAPNCS